MGNSIIPNKYIDRFFTKIDFPEDAVNDCWLWTGYKFKGYGSYRMGVGTENRHTAHRCSYLMFVDDNVSPKEHVDHICENPPCVNPNHLQVLSIRENTLKGTSPPAVNIKKTHCKYGHRFTKENTWGRKHRICRECSNRKWREWYHAGGKHKRK